MSVTPETSSDLIDLYSVAEKIADKLKVNYNRLFLFLLYGLFTNDNNVENESAEHASGRTVKSHEFEDIRPRTEVSVIKQNKGARSLPRNLKGKVHEGSFQESSQKRRRRSSSSLALDVCPPFKRFKLETGEEQSSEFCFRNPQVKKLFLDWLKNKYLEIREVSGRDSVIQTTCLANIIYSEHQIKKGSREEYEQSASEFSEAECSVIFSPTSCHEENSDNDLVFPTLPEHDMHINDTLYINGYTTTNEQEDRISQTQQQFDEDDYNDLEQQTINKDELEEPEFSEAECSAVFSPTSCHEENSDNYMVCPTIPEHDMQINDTLCSNGSTTTNELEELIRQTQEQSDEYDYNDLEQQPINKDELEEPEFSEAECSAVFSPTSCHEENSDNYMVCPTIPEHDMQINDTFCRNGSTTTNELEELIRQTQKQSDEYDYNDLEQQPINKDELEEPEFSEAECSAVFSPTSYHEENSDNDLVFPTPPEYDIQINDTFCRNGSTTTNEQEEPISQTQQQSDEYDYNDLEEKTIIKQKPEEPDIFELSASPSLEDIYLENAGSLEESSDSNYSDIHSRFWLRSDDFYVSLKIDYYTPEDLNAGYELFTYISCETEDFDFGIDGYGFSRNHDNLRGGRDFSLYWLYCDGTFIPFKGKKMSSERILRLLEYIRVNVQVESTFHFGIDDVNFSDIQDSSSQPTELSGESTPNYNHSENSDDFDWNDIQVTDENLEGSNHSLPIENNYSVSSLSSNGSSSESGEITYERDSTDLPIININDHSNQQDDADEATAFNNEQESLCVSVQEMLSLLRQQQQSLAIITDKLTESDSVAGARIELDAFKGTSEYFEMIRTITGKIYQLSNERGFKNCSLTELENCVYYLVQATDACLQSIGEPIKNILTALNGQIEEQESD